jgi:hypothetical protein
MKVRVLIAAGAAVMAVAVVATPATTGFKRQIPQVVSAAAAPASQTNTLLQQ